MLSLDAKRNPRNYGLVNGMWNVAWITGWVRKIDRKNNMFYIQQSNNQKRILPIHGDTNTRLPANTRETHSINVIARIEGHFDAEKNERTILMRAIGFERPSIMSTSPDAAWHNIWTPQTDVENFKPIGGLSGRLNASSNVVKIAGFVEATVLTRGEHPSLIILVRQHLDVARAIPIRITGPKAKPAKDRLPRGFPLSVQAEYAVMDQPVKNAAEGEADSTVKIPYIHAIHLAPATNEEITVMPNWCREAYPILFRQPKQEKKPSEPEVTTFAEVDVENI